MARLLGLGAMSWFIFWACAPMMSTPPATPMTDPGRSEIGVSAHGGGGFGRQTNNDEDKDLPSVLGGGTIWMRNGTGPDLQNQVGVFLHVQLRHKLGCTEDYCQDGSWGMGSFYRKTLSQSDRFYSGVQLTVGYPFAAVGVPMAWSMGDGMWLTTQPRIGWGYASMVHLPVGLSMPAGKHGQFNAEIGVHLDAGALGAAGAPLVDIRDEVYDGHAHYKIMPYIGVGYAMMLGQGN